MKYTNANILVCSNKYYPEVYGYPKNVHELAKRLVQRDYRVTVMTTHQSRGINVEVVDNVMVIRIPCFSLLNGQYPIPNKWPLNKNEVFDVVITQTRFYPLSFMGMVYAKRNKIPLIHVERGSRHNVNNKIVEMIARVYDHTLGSSVVKNADINIGVSKAACNFIEHLGGKNIQCIYNGINLTDNTRLVIPHATKKIVFAGRLIYAKGVHDLIEAFEVCFKREGNLRLIIIGDGNYRKQLEYQVLKSAYKNHIQFMGQLPYDDLISVLSIADIFVNPSYSEGLPTSVIEAASIGLPIVATDVGGTNEIIEHANTGLLTKPKEVLGLAFCMLKLLKNDEYAKQLGLNAQKLAIEKFDWNKIVEKYDEVIRNLC